MVLIQGVLYYRNNGISNLLNKVEDASGTNGFVNSADSIKEYSFDGNGNPTADLNKGYTNILYNYLNLPKQIATTTEKTKYIYDASGMKLAKVGTENDTSYYAGNFVYKGSSLNYIIHEEGHIDPSEAEKYKYYQKVHLGSVRMVVKTNGTDGTIERQTDYNPFGMTIAEYNGSVVDYGYNGKELQNDLINNKKLDWYDYRYRFYDPQIARFNSIDRLADKYPYKTPYDYAENRPIDGFDLDGLEWTPAATAGAYHPVEAANSLKHMEVDPKSQELGRKMVSSTFSIVGGAFLTVSSGGTASPWLLSGKLITGLYGIFSGASNGILDATGNSADANKIPSTYSGALLGQTIDFIRGGNDKKAEKTFDFIQNIATMKGSDVLSTSVGVEQVVESAIALKQEFSSGSSTGKSDTQKTSPSESKPEKGKSEAPLLYQLPRPEEKKPPLIPFKISIIE